MDFDLDCDPLKGDVLCARGCLVGLNCNCSSSVSAWKSFLSFKESANPYLCAYVDLKPTICGAGLELGLTLVGNTPLLESSSYWPLPNLVSAVDRPWVCNPSRCFKRSTVSLSPVILANCYSLRAICLLSSSCRCSICWLISASSLGGDVFLT